MEHSGQLRWERSKDSEYLRKGEDQNATRRARGITKKVKEANVGIKVP
jgi:hypothetical protein